MHVCIEQLLCARQFEMPRIYLCIYTSCEELTHWKRLWCWERLGTGGEGDDPGWDGWMASWTRWTWVWVNSGRWWWTATPGMLRFMGLQRVRHDWTTELKLTCSPGNRDSINSVNKKIVYSMLESNKCSEKKLKKRIGLQFNVIIDIEEKDLKVRDEAVQIFGSPYSK